MMAVPANTYQRMFSLNLKTTAYASLLKITKITKNAATENSLHNIKANMFYFVFLRNVL